MAVVAEHRTTIDGVTYTTRTFPATEGLDLIQRLVRLLGPDAMRLVLELEDHEAGAVLGEAAVVAAMVSGAASRAEPGEFASMAKAVLKYTHADQVTIGDAVVAGSVATHFDTHFAARYQHLMEVCIWAARASFGTP